MSIKLSDLIKQLNRRGAQDFDSTENYIWKLNKSGDTTTFFFVKNLLDFINDSKEQFTITTGSNFTLMPSDYSKTGTPPNIIKIQKLEKIENFDINDYNVELIKEQKNNEIFGELFFNRPDNLDYRADYNNDSEFLSRCTPKKYPVMPDSIEREWKDTPLKPKTTKKDAIDYDEHLKELIIDESM